jgi:hypothetical protein
MVILDQPGAERLKGKGDLLLSREGSLTRIQVPNTTPADGLAA